MILQEKWYLEWLVTNFEIMCSYSLILWLVKFNLYNGWLHLMLILFFKQLNILKQTNAFPYLILLQQQHNLPK